MWFKRILGLTLALASLLHCYASKVDTVLVFSNAMHKSIKNIVILPDNYNKNKVYPVVYLLHGAGDNSKAWISKVPEVKNYSDQYHFIIVCPDGGVTSWYFDSPVDTTMRYETFVSKELVNYIDGHYSTVKNKNGRAITGLSMGGHGALYLSIRHPETFGAAGSMSGGVDIRPFPNNWDLSKRLGEMTQNSDNWNKNTVINLVDSLKAGSLRLIIDCGVDDFFYTVNKSLHAKLLALKIPHYYIERPGVHNWDYWTNAVKYHMMFFNDYFKINGQKDN